MHVDLAAVRDEHVALESVDVDRRDRHLGSAGRQTLELAGVSAGEPGSRDTVGAVD